MLRFLQLNSKAELPKKRTRKNYYEKENGIEENKTKHQIQEDGMFELYFTYGKINEDERKHPKNRCALPLRIITKLARDTYYTAVDVCISSK